MANKAQVLLEFLGKDGVSKVVTGIRGQISGLKDEASGLYGKIAGLGAAIVSSQVLRYLVDTNRQYGVFLTQLETITGSAANARAVFDDLAKFAAKTPFQIEELTKAFVTLKAGGIAPSMQMLTRFGDIAASMGGRIDDFASAVREALMGETRRLKEFNVDASIQGDKMVMSFQGHATVIGRNARELTAYLEQLGATKFAGGMERQARTLDGAISNLEDAVASLARKIGDAGLTKDLTDFARTLTGISDAAGESEVNLRRLYTLIHTDSSATWTILSDGLAMVTSKFLLMAHAIGMAAAAMGVIVTFGQNQKMWDLLGKQMDGFTAALNLGATHGSSLQAVQAAYGAHTGTTPISNGEHWAASYATPHGTGIPTVTDPKQQPNNGPPTLHHGKTANEKLTDRAKGLNDTLELAQKSSFVERQTLGLSLPDLSAQAELAAAGLEARARAEKDPKIRAAMLEAAVKIRKALGQLTGTPDMSMADALIAQQQPGMRGLDAQQSAFARGAGDTLPDVFGNMALQSLTVGAAAADGSRMVASQGAGFGSPGGLGATLSERFGDAIQNAKTFQETIADITQNTMGDFGNAVTLAFKGFVDGSHDAGAAFKAAFLNAIASVAKAKGDYYLAEALGALGSGLLFDDPKAFAAAAKYGAAAAAFYAVAGTAMGALGGGGGGGGGQSSANRSAANIADANRPDATLVIDGDFLDMSNPQTEARFVAALEALSNRRVTVQKRGG